jgi:hypothetical protein
MNQQQAPREAITFLYVAGVDPAGPYKVGYSRDPAARLVALRAPGGIPARVRETVNRKTVLLAATFPCPSRHARTAEGEAHRLLRSHCLHGEWFAVTQEEAEAAIVAGIERTVSGKAERSLAPVTRPSRSTYGGRTAAIGLRLQPALKEIAHSAAKTDRRTLANWIETLVVRELERLHLIEKDGTNA